MNSKFKRLRRQPAPLPAPSRPMVVIGDIHGRLDLLERMLDNLYREPDLDPNTDLVFAGDLVDRGPDSAGVIALVRHLDAQFGDKVTVLMGNHERMMLDYLLGHDRTPAWLHVGGHATLQSYGATIEPGAPAPAEPPVVPTAVIDWLQDRPLVFSSGDVVAVHAAFDPETAQEHQDERLLLWGARDFYRRRRPGPPWVVHGHVITRPPAVQGCRIPVDTGAWLTGQLTAAILVPDQPVRFTTAEC